MPGQAAPKIKLRSGDSSVLQVLYLPHIRQMRVRNWPCPRPPSPQRQACLRFKVAIVNSGEQDCVLRMSGVGVECALGTPLEFGLRMRTGMVTAERVPDESEVVSLVVAAREGDRGSFGRLYERYARMVHGILLWRGTVGGGGGVVWE